MYSLDNTDRKILHILQREGRLSNQELAERVNISTAACWRRTRALEERGVIAGYCARLDRKAMALGLCSFVHVTLSRHEMRDVEEFEKMITERDEVLECHATAGEADYLLKVVTRDLEHFDAFLKETLFALPGIRQTHSNISIREIKSTTQLPLGQY